MTRDNRKDLYLEDENISKTQKLELDRYQKYLKSIKKYDPQDEEEYLYLTRELGNLINENDNLSDIEVLELTTKLEKIENTKDYTIELLELTREIKKIMKTSKKEIPRISKKENPRKITILPSENTSILPKINKEVRRIEKVVPKKEEIPKEKVVIKKTPEVKKDERLTFKDLVDKNTKNRKEIEPFNTEQIKMIRTKINNRPKVKREESKASKIFWSVTFVISLLVFIFLVYRFIKWEVENRMVESQINSIYNSAQVLEVTTQGAITDVGDLPVEEQKPVIPPKEEEYRPNDYWYYMSMSLLDVNFEELSKKNSDTAGWIQVAGTNINYPYVHTTNNDYYLDHSFDKSYNSAGWVFLDYRNKPDTYGRNNILYAHSRLDNTMFGSLRDVVTPSWYNNSNNYVVKTSNKEYNALWQVFSVYTIAPESYYIKTKFNDDEFDKFLNTISSRSVHDFNVDLTIEDKILTLSSCYFENKRVVLHAKLIRIEEK